MTMQDLPHHDLPAQALEDDIHLFTLDDMLLPAVEDATITAPFWDQRPTLEDNMVKGAILTRWRTGAISSQIALDALMEFGVMDYDAVMELYSAYLLTNAKLEG